MLGLYMPCGNDVGCPTSGAVTRCNLSAMLMEVCLKQRKKSAGEPVDAKHYQNFVGSLRYRVPTRPDITFALGYVSRFMEEPIGERRSTAGRMKPPAWSGTATPTS